MRIDKFRTREARKFQENYMKHHHIDITKHWIYPLSEIETAEEQSGALLLYKHKPADAAIETAPGRQNPASFFVLRGSPLWDGDDELAVDVGGGGERGAGVRREPESPAIELEGAVVDLAGIGGGGGADHDLHDAGVDLDGEGADVVPEVVGGGDEAEPVGVLLDGDVGVGAEGELQHLAEDVWKPPELLLPPRASADSGGGGGGEDGVGVVADGDVPLLGRRVHPHGSHPSTTTTETLNLALIQTLTLASDDTNRRRKPQNPTRNSSNLIEKTENSTRKEQLKSKP